MKDLVSFTYDFFGHILPGIVILFSLSLIDWTPDCKECMIGKFSKIGTELGTVIVILAYIIGFAINPIGRFTYRTLGFKLWPKKVVNHVDLFVSDKYVLIREFSPKNFEYIERWNTYCAMAHNLAMSTLVLALVAIYRMINDWSLEYWLLILIFALFLFFVLIYRAVLFSIWANHDVNATISRLNLKEKVAEE